MKKINIELRLFITLKQYLPEGSSEGRAVMSFDYGSTIGDIISILNIPVDQQKLILINGVSQGISDEINTRVLNDGDIVSMFPPVGGG
ncbi:MoaD/ThiS family protein [Desulfobacterium sp. N47]|uniref:Ubiquitin Mut7-C domain-containing protein n=1 Tax=uncultured Desulfobacterium sp. TaxID=201089 RepID=E1YBI8_9BACT|nr:unknown protein [uncultured Desulfobacterium sp.]